jgi:hypothetical protein
MVSIIAYTSASISENIRRTAFPFQRPTDHDRPPPRRFAALSVESSVECVDAREGKRPAEIVDSGPESRSPDCGK